jgi:hypothetical protein
MAELRHQVRVSGESHPHLPPISGAIMRYIRTAALAALVTASGVTTAHAQLIGPTYPAPAGNTFQATPTTVGAAARTAGQERAYGGFDDNSFDQLYWAFTEVLNPYYVGPQGQTYVPLNPAPLPPGAGAMTFIGFTSPGLAVWQSTVPFIFNTANQGLVNVGTVFFEAQIQTYQPGTNSGQTAAWLPWTTAAAAGISTIPGSWPVFNVAANPGYNFDVWTRWTVGSPQGPGLLDYYESFNTQLGGSVKTSNSAGFFYTKDQVTTTPEPASIALMATGLVAVIGITRRKKAARPS